jgi:hypothetical protein
MRRIRIENPLLQNTYISDVAVDYTSGVALTARSNNSFAANDLAVFGNPGEELTELKKIDSLSGNTGFVLPSTLKFSHNKGTPIYKTLWDFVSIEGRSSSAGVFAELTQSAIQWDSKTNRTIYFHSAGTDNWEYRFRFYNSVTGLYSEYSPTLSGLGFVQNQMGYIIRDARMIAGDEDGEIISTPEALRILTRAKNIIRAHNPRYWFWKVDGYNSSKSIAAIAGSNVYDFSTITDLGVIDVIDYAYVQDTNINKYSLKRKSDAEFKEYTHFLNRPSLDWPRFYRLLPPDANSTKGYFEIEQKILTTGVGTFYIDYYKEETNYNSVDDTTAVIMPEILEDYLISKIYARKGNEALGKDYYKMFAGPEQREKTLALEELTGIALLDELDKQYKKSQGQPMSLVRFRGQKGMSHLYGSPRHGSTDWERENFFDSSER